ncbi:hypothetical protein [Microbaculum marinum]|uniref:Sulfotransferase family protein n=1 Tax=Microbaculum marinum TaxID=1764581 RepID=A0AAW9S0P5_9HYPH
MAPAEPVRIAMWSGPRNISTAMMRSFGNRPDTRVVDEPFYAAYLDLTGIDHPMRNEVIASGTTDWRRVADDLLSFDAEGISVHYQKQMTHHMLPEIGRDWLARMKNAFLIRRPENVLASYVRKREAVTLEDIGFLQQAELFDLVADALGEPPPVIDARDVLEDPKGMLAALCGAVGIPFRDEMLAWDPGFRATDGVWGAHWYEAVAASTGFGPPNPDVEDLPPHLLRIAEAARPIYDRLSQVKLAPVAAAD